MDELDLKQAFAELVATKRSRDEETIR